MLLPPQNGSKTLAIQYYDAAGNASSWVYAYITLNEDWYTLSAGRRGEMVGANYLTPSSVPTTSDAVEDTSFLTGPSPLNFTTGSQGTRSYVFQSNGNGGTPQIGIFDYYMSGTTISFYYQTFNSANNSINGSWTSGSVNLATSGTYYYLDLDNPTWNATTSYSSNMDFYFYNVSGTLYLYLLTGNPTNMRYALF